jgi:hypothetical protein
VFAGVISRENGEPWGPTGMTSRRWLSVPVQRVRIADLIATQPAVNFQPLIEAPAPIGGDPFAHVIAWRGRLYLEDGHTRTLRAALGGHAEIDARVLVVSDTCERDRV